MAKSKFDTSLLKPVKSGWDESKLTPVEDEEIPYTPPPERKGFGGIWEDVTEIPGKALDYGMDLPGQAAASGSQLTKKPGRSLMNLLAGVGELGEGIINLPYEGIKYLGEKDVIPDWLKKYNETGMRIPFTNKHIPTHIPNLGIEEALLGKEEEGDQFLRQLPGLYAGGKAILSVPGVKGAAKRIIAQKEHKPLTKKVGELEKQQEEADGKHGAAETEFNVLKDFLERQPGFESSNPAVLERKALEAQSKLDALKQQSEAVPEHLRATEEPVAPEKTPLSIVEPIRAGEKPEISEEPIKQAESLLKTNEQKSAELEQKFGEGHLRKGFTHDVPIAEGVTGKIKERKKEIGKIYDTVEKDLEEKHVLIPQTEQLANAEKSVRNLLKDSRGFFKSDEEFEAAVQKMAKADQGSKGRGPSDIVPAADVLKNYRTVRHLGQKLRSEAYTSKVASNKELQADMLAKADEFENTANNLEGLLEQNDLGGSLETLKTANKRWREEVTPLYKNKTYRQFLTGLGPDNIMKALRGNGPGQEIIRKIIKEDPELLRNIVGQRYAHNPAKLHEFDELTHEYTQHMPEVQEFRKQHFESKQAENQAKMNLERAKHEHQTQREQVDIAHRKATEKAAEETRAKKSEVHKENQTKQKEHEEKFKYVKMQKDIKELDERYAKLTDSAKKMQEKANRKNISLKEKMDIEHQLSQTKKKLSALQKDRDTLFKTAKRLGYVGATLAIGTPVVKKAKSLITGS